MALAWDAGAMSDRSGHQRVGTSYDAVAAEYAARFGDELTQKPLDRALLGALVDETPVGSTIVDLGCGPGHVAGWLADRGVASVGIDLSPAMVEIARRSHPRAAFREGDLLSLPAGDAEFGAAIAFYSIIHLDPRDLGSAFSEVRRVLRPSGRFLVAFHAGSERRHLADWHGHAVDLDFQFLEPTTVIEALQRQGFRVQAEMKRRNYPTEVESLRAYVLAQRG